jgi:hypothetical protein
MQSRDLLTRDYWFDGHMRPPAVGSPDGTPWRSKSLAAHETIQTANLGLMQLALTAANEAQNACLYFGDVLSMDITKLVSFEVWAQLTANFAAANTMTLGLASARNDTPESVTALAAFKCVGNNNVVVSAHDGTNSQANIATGFTLDATYLKRFMIDLGTGINSVVGGASSGGRVDTRLMMDNGRGNLRRVCPNTRFDLSAYALGVQPFFQVQKTAGVTTGTLSIKRVRIVEKMA